uniref:(northern house mosquito) hypothetical protein n=1 Tax=Culex pipiens TaxID=7175 RepID=A0A8D8CE85_CULPI
MRGKLVFARLLLLLCCLLPATHKHRGCLRPGLAENWSADRSRLSGAASCDHRSSASAAASSYCRLTVAGTREAALGNRRFCAVAVSAASKTWCLAPPATAGTENRRRKRRNIALKNSRKRQLVNTTDSYRV